MTPPQQRTLPSGLPKALVPFAPACLVVSCLLALPAAPSLRLGDRSASPREELAAQPQPAIPVHPLPADTAAELLERLDRAWRQTDGLVPGLAPAQFPLDLDQLEVAERKEAFLRSLLPHVLSHNDRIAAERRRLLMLAEQAAASVEWQAHDLEFLEDLADRYRLGATNTGSDQLLRALLGRVDVVPPSLALAQAAIESAWGTSRFVQLGNNLFGQWVFHRDRGIAPLDRPADGNYSLARFASLGHAVEAYLRNLNGFSAYREFRRLRREMREASEPLDAYRLAEGLTNYSTRREEYVQEIHSVIRGNDLTRFDQAYLADPDATRPM